MFRGKGDQAEARELAVGLYREHRGYLLRIARSNTKSTAVAEEALQEAFISFLRHFDPGRGAPPIAWLTLTLRRECLAQAGSREMGSARGPGARAGRRRAGFRAGSDPVAGDGSRGADRRAGSCSAPARASEARRAHRPRLTGRWLLVQGDRRAARLDLHEDQPLHPRGAGGTRDDLIAYLDRDRLGDGGTRRPPTLS